MLWHADFDGFVIFAITQANLIGFLQHSVTDEGEAGLGAFAESLGGAKTVEGKGDTLADLLGDLDSRHQGLRDRLVDDAGLRRFVNVYLNDEDVRFLGGLQTPVTDGDTVTVLPAVAGGSR